MAAAGRFTLRPDHCLFLLFSAGIRQHFLHGRKLFPGHRMSLLRRLFDGLEILRPNRQGATWSSFLPSYSSFDVDRGPSFVYRPRCILADSQLVDQTAYRRVFVGIRRPSTAGIGQPMHQHGLERRVIGGMGGSIAARGQEHVLP